MKASKWLSSVAALAVAVWILSSQVGCPKSGPPASSPELGGYSPSVTAPSAVEGPAAVEEEAAPAPAASKEEPPRKPEAKAAAAHQTPVKVKLPLGLPALPIPDDNRLTKEKIALGKKLYFDKRLSKDGTISCATCHAPENAWAEHTPTSKGIGGQIGPANAPTVINSAYATSQFWDGRAASLEEQALGPIEAPIEMGHKLDALVKQLAEIPQYVEGFQTAFGTPPTKDGIGKAIASFERTVLSGNSPYDKFKAGDEKALSDAQKRGLDLFESAGCADCHAPPLFSSYRFFNAGVGMDKNPPDQGRKGVTNRDSDLGKFRIPALREVAGTAPYFHDGSAATLEDAVKLMAGGGKDNPNLSGMMKAVRDTQFTEENVKDLVEFLKALSGDYPKGG